MTIEAPMQQANRPYNIFAINGSASKNSSNLRLIERFIDVTKDDFNVTLCEDLKTIPPFDPELSVGDPPQPVFDLRKGIEQADGVLICTPEYVFSIPAGLKNALEWCVSTTIFSEKPVAVITASASGQKGHEQLQMIMSTLMARMSPGALWLIPGIKARITVAGEIIDATIETQLRDFVAAFKSLLQTSEH